MADREDSERLRSDSNSDFVTVSRTPECLLRVHSPRTVQSLQGTFTTYCLSFQTTSPVFHLKKSRVRRRFSEFVWLRKKLAKMNNWGNPPPLPAKRFWNVLDPELIESRQEQLQKWIYTVLSEAEYLSCSALHLFLQTELSTAEIQDYLDGSLSEDNIRDLWNNHGRRYNYQPHNPLHNFVDQDPVEILFTEDDITTPDEANLAPTMAPPHPPCPPHPAATTTTPTTPTTTATPAPHPEADNTMDFSQKTGGRFQECSLESSHDHLHVSWARQNSGSDVEEAQRGHRDWGHLSPAPGSNASELNPGNDDHSPASEAQEEPRQQQQQQQQQQQSVQTQQRDPQAVQARSRAVLGSADEESLQSLPEGKARLWREPQQTDELCNKEPGLQHSAGNSEPATEPPLRSQPSDAEPELRRDGHLLHGQQQDQEQRDHDDQHKQAQQEQAQAQQEEEQQEQKQHKQAQQEQEQEQQEQEQHEQAQQEQEQHEQAQQEQAQQEQEQQQQEQAQQQQEQEQQEQEQQEQEQEQQEQREHEQQEQEQIQQQQEQAQQQQEQAQQQQEQAQQQQEQQQQEQNQQQRVQAQQKQEQDQQKHEQQDQKQTQHEKTQQQISPTQPSSETAGSQEDRHAAVTPAGLLTAGKAADAGGKGGVETRMDCPDLQSSPPTVGLALSINGD